MSSLPPDPQRADELLERLLDLDPENRLLLLDEETQGDPELRALRERLLGHSRITCFDNVQAIDVLTDDSGTARGVLALWMIG